MIWTIEPLQTEPEIILTKWSAYDIPLIGETQPWTRHFVGFSKELSEGQSTAAVVAFDPIKQIGRTKSGRTYRLVGAPGHCMPAKLVWSKWKHLSKVASEHEVTEEVLGLMMSFASGHAIPCPD